MLLRLTDLEPSFVRYDTRRRVAAFHKPGASPCQSDPTIPHTDECWEPEREYDAVIISHVERIEDAQGIEFLCPLCFEKNGHSNIGVHMVMCWSRSRGVPDDAQPGPGRWRLAGTGFHDLSLMEEPGKSRSVALLSGCMWHGFVTNGDVT